MKSILKQSLPHLAALLIFFALISVYFYPSIYEGKGIQQSDMQSYYGATEELLKYHEEEGGSSAWTGTLFSGMPAYHIYIYGTPKNYMRYVEKPIKAI
ncbi:hypothetical protein LJB91_03315, partial [Bacteroidales bacterium OttesenSCG-928-L03]|nr:hypothetical protein [Bacteroidales bacterium OttesenSCG-928-L03]